MSEYGYARLEIGGRVQRTSLLQALTAEGFAAGHLGEALQAKEARGSKSSTLFIEHDQLVVQDDEARFAEFTNLESALIKAGIAFDRDSGAVADYGEQTLRFRPGYPIVEGPTNNGHVLVPVDTVRAKLATSPRTLTRWLNTHYPDLPPLPAFQVVDDKRRKPSAAAGRHHRPAS